MQIQNNHVVIMAGGIGSRFWPLSTTERPKQFIDVLGCGKTLIQLTAERFKGICNPGNIWVVTSAKYASLVKEQLPEIPSAHILCEPCMRNTAPCIAYVSWKIKSKYPDANVVITPSDHIVMNVTEFQRVIGSSLRFASKTKTILTLGMKPTRSETGYGYIETDLNRVSEFDKDIYQVKSFREKPDLKTAQDYIAESNYLWNSGLFIWHIDTLIEAMNTYQPEIAQVFEELLPYYYTENEQEMIDKEFPKCKNISVDYAILEKAKDLFVFPADFGWSDLGTWGSLHTQLSKDGAQNAFVGNKVRLYDTQNCIISVPDANEVVVQGLDGYIVAEKEGRLLICKLDQEQRIKEFSQ